MTRDPARIAALVHPALSLVAIALLARAASLGFAARERRGEGARTRHGRLAPLAFVLVAANAALGIASTRLWRPDLSPGASPHLAVGIAVVALLGTAALLSRRIGDAPWARRAHPWLGVAGLLLAAVQFFFGMALLPL